MHLKILSTLLCALAYTLSVQATPKHDPVPGGIALIPIPANQQSLRAFYKTTPVAIFSANKKHYAMVGIALSSRTGKQHIDVLWNDGRKQTHDFFIKPKTYQEQYLTIKNKRKVNPYKKDMPRIIKEKARKNKARTHWTDQLVNLDFIIPVEGRISSVFGLKRFFNNQPRRPHSGLDIAAPEGTAIKAIEAGTIIESGDFFFSGNMVYIDHGQGIISLYAHMHNIYVKTGDSVSKGQVIGTVGETGRVTGPHLHLAIIANQNLIDPALLLPDINIAQNTTRP
jgi:murein DD-endopeptidase MepM/ murein hydrolase activator NlpD